MPYALEGAKWGTGTRGTTATVIWSFADAELTSELSASFGSYPTLNGGISAGYRNSVRSAFSLWSAVTGVTFIEKADSAVNDLRVGQANIDGDGPIAGLARYWFSGAMMEKATIQFDADAFLDPQGFYAVALHEIGHAIGLGHSPSPSDLMYPSISTQNLSGLSIDDMTGARVIYASGVTLQGTPVADLLTGGDGDDLIFGKEGGDTISAGAGNNIVVGGLDSADGADVISAGLGNDLIYGNGGNDTIDSFGGNDIAVGGFGSDVITLGAGNDIVYGNQGNDLINAGDGNNLIFGGMGDDVILAGSGNDIIYAGEGGNSLTGGGGADRYMFDLNGGAAVIYGFSRAEGDILDFGGQRRTVISRGDEDVLIGFGAGSTIHLAGVSTSSWLSSS